MSLPRAYAAGDTAEGVGVKLHGVPEREKQFNDIREISQLKFKYRNREFWCRGHYVDTAGKNAKKIQEYIKNQLEEDQAGEQLAMSK